MQLAEHVCRASCIIVEFAGARRFAFALMEAQSCLSNDTLEINDVVLELLTATRSLSPGQRSK